MTNPSHLKVRYLFELPELPPGEVENSWTYTYVPNGPDKDYKVFLPTLIAEAVDDVSADILQAAADYTDQETANALSAANLYTDGAVDDVRQDLLSTEYTLGTAMVQYKLPDDDSVGRLLRDKLGDFISAKDFGAVGDGVSLNEAAAINAALQYLKSKGGGTLYIPAGVYLLTSGIFVPSNCTLQGAGIDATILRAVDPFPVTHNLITNESNDQLPRTNYDYNIHICDMSVDGNWPNRNTAGSANGNGCGVRFSTVHDSSIRRVKAYYNVNHNIDIAASVNPNTTDNPPGGPNALGPSLRITVEDCQAHTPHRDDNFTVHGSGYVTFSRCYAWFDHTVHPNIGTTQHGIEFDDGAYECTARDCYVEGLNDGFQVKGHDGIIAARNILIERCYAKNCARGINITRDAPYDGLDVTIRDCIVDGVQPHAVTDLQPIRIYGYTNVLVDNVQVLNVNNAPNAVRIGPSSNNITIRNLSTRDSPFDPAGPGVVYAQAGGPPQNIVVENLYCETPIEIPMVRFSSNGTRGIIRNISATAATASTYPAIYIPNTVNSVYIEKVNATNFSGQLEGTSGSGFLVPNGIEFSWKPGGVMTGSGSIDPNGNVPANSGSIFLRDGVGMYVREASGIGTVWVAK